MKRFLPLLGFTALGFFPSTYVIAEEQPSSKIEERAEHYGHVTFETSEQAIEALNNSIKEIDAILSKDGGIEFTDLELAHEKSYTLESAVDKLRADKFAEEKKINELDEAVQALHFASENQKLADSQEWLMKVKTATSKLAHNENAAAAPEKKDFYEIVIKDHIFSPTELRVPAGEKIKLIVDNQDPTPEEFESHDLNREKIIPGNSKATIFVGPLTAGKYEYFGEFNLSTAKAVIIAE